MQSLVPGHTQTQDPTLRSLQVLISQFSNDALVHYRSLLSLELKESYRTICSSKVSVQVGEEPLPTCQQNLQLASNTPLKPQPPPLDEEHQSTRWGQTSAPKLTHSSYILWVWLLAPNTENLTFHNQHLI